MPTAMVNSVLRQRQATTPATSAAISLTLPAPRASSPGAANTIAGTTIAVSIAAGTWRKARASSGGISRRANSAMNDRRVPKLIAPTTTINDQIRTWLVSRLDLRRRAAPENPVGDDPGHDAGQTGANHRQAHRHRVERDGRDGRDREHDQRRSVVKQRREQGKKTQGNDEFQLPRRRDDGARQDAGDGRDLPSQPEHGAAADEIGDIGADIRGLAKAPNRRRERLVGQQERDQVAPAMINRLEIRRERRAVHQ